MGAAGRKMIEQTYDWRKTLPAITAELAKASRPSVKNTPNPASYYAVQAVLLENHPNMDFADLQRGLLAPKRSGRGEELQNRCGETSRQQTEWIESILAAKRCDGSDPLDSDGLFKSSVYQCGAWCVFDLSTVELAGHSYNGFCWTRMNSNNWCKDYYVNRPKISI